MELKPLGYKKLDNPIDLFETDDLQTWLELFLYSRKAANLTESTLYFYHDKLSRFIEFCNNLAVEGITDISPLVIRKFLILLEERGHNSGGIHGFFRSIRAFLNFYENEAEPDGWRNPIKKVKAPVVPLEPLDPVSIDTVRALINTCKTNSFYDLRDRAIILFLLDTGARSSECLSINCEDVDLITGTILIRSGKGRKPRETFLGETSRRALRKYLRNRKSQHVVVWLNRNGVRLGRAGLREILRRRAKRANVTAPSPHAFRRSFALERWRAGVDLLTLSKLMGHSSLSTLHKYLKQTGDDLSQIARSSSPVDRNLKI